MLMQKSLYVIIIIIINYIKRDCFQLNKKTVQIYIIKMNNNDNL